MYGLNFAWIYFEILRHCAIVIMASYTKWYIKQFWYVIKRCWEWNWYCTTNYYSNWIKKLINLDYHRLKKQKTIKRKQLKSGNDVCGSNGSLKYNLRNGRKGSSGTEKNENEILLKIRAFTGWRIQFGMFLDVCILLMI